jgi:hypothetical protein
MPGPRCIFDGVLLPNGHVVLMGGQKVRARGCGDCASLRGGGGAPPVTPLLPLLAEPKNLQPTNQPPTDQPINQLTSQPTNP